MRLQGLQIQEDRRAVLARGLEQWGGDQVPDPACGQQVLGWEQPVVACQTHPAAQRHRLAQQPGAEPTGYLGRDRGGEEHPRVRADSGPGDLQSDRDLQGTAGLYVHEDIEHRLRAVEVSGQPPALVTVQQRIQPDMNLALQVGGQYLRGERQIVAVLVADSLLPAAAHRRDPSGLARPLVIEPDRVHIRSRREQRAEERHLGVLRRPVMHESGRNLEVGGLRGAGWGRLLRGEPQQLEQPGILRPQLRQLSLKVRRDISHGHKLSTRNYRNGGISTCPCRKSHPCSSCRTLVHMEHPSKSVASSYVEAGDLVRGHERHGQVPCRQ